jgi:hypothetical protein
MQVHNKQLNILAINFIFQYFDAISRNIEEKHALTRSRLSHLIFVWGHIPLSFYMLTTTVGLVVMYLKLNDHQPVDKYFERMLSLGASLQALCLIIMRIEHKGIQYSFASANRVAHLIVRLLLALCHFLLRYSGESTTTQITLHACIALIINVVDIGVSYKTKVVTQSESSRNSFEMPKVHSNPMNHKHHDDDHMDEGRLSVSGAGMR